MPGSSVKFELTPNQLQNDLHAGVEATATSGGYERINIILSASGRVMAQTYGTKGQSLLTDLGAYVPGKTYVVEILTEKSSATLYFYEKGQGKATGYTHSISDNFTWTQARTTFWARTYSNTPATTTAYIDNIEETSPAARSTKYVYDADGRPVYEMDALGGVTKTRYDASGRLVERIQLANRISPDTVASSGAFDAAVSSSAALDRPTRYVYDMDGQLRFTINALGGVVENIYDAFGRVARVVAYDTALNYTSIADTTSADAVRAMLPATVTANSRETVYTYNALGQLVHSAQSLALDASGNKTFAVSENQFDAFGHVLATKRYANTVLLRGLANSVSTTALAARLAPLVDVSKDRLTRFEYDAAGRLAKTTDGEGYTETFTYDAAGNKTRYTNKNGDVFDYTYDSVGRLLSELGPVVDITTVTKPAGSLQVGVQTAQRIETRYAYDSAGNLTSRTEAYGRPEQRTTRYDHDALGRQIRTTHEAVGIYDANLDNPAANGINGSAVYRAEATKALTSETVYNAFGEAIIGRDVAGNYSACPPVPASPTAWPSASRSSTPPPKPPHRPAHAASTAIWTSSAAPAASST